jgi:hypothetical protein
VYAGGDAIDGDAALYDVGAGAQVEVANVVGLAANEGAVVAESGMVVLLRTISILNIGIKGAIIGLGETWLNRMVYLILRRIRESLDREIRSVQLGMVCASADRVK